MARKIKRYGKVINDNSVAMEIYTKQKTLCDQADELDKQSKKHFLVYCQMEGKYSLGIVPDPWAGQGYRRYDYKYPSQEVKAKEYAERRAYLEEHVRPLDEKVAELRKQIRELEESLCVAVCGYGTQEYYLRSNLAQAEKELAQQTAYVERLKKELAEIKNRG